MCGGKWKILKSILNFPLSEKAPPPPLTCGVECAYMYECAKQEPPVCRRIDLESMVAFFVRFSFFHIFCFIFIIGVLFTFIRRSSWSCRHLLAPINVFSLESTSAAHFKKGDFATNARLYPGICLKCFEGWRRADRGWQRRKFFIYCMQYSPPL